ncbi:MAG: FecR domain-containing protein [Thermoanaerobaculia bacterium]
MTNRGRKILEMEPLEPFDERELERMMREAGPPAENDGSDLEAVRAEARTAWRNRYPAPVADRPRRLPAWGAWAAVAVVVLAVALVSGLTRSGGSGEGARRVATIDIVTGEVRLLRAAGSRPAAIADGVEAGDELVTGTRTGASGRAALRLGADTVIRIDTGSRVHFAGDGRLDLLSGALYVDHRANAGSASSGLRVVTSAGEVRDVGTQFEVRLEPPGSGPAMRVRVREGEVLFTGTGASLRAARGEELRVADDGTAVRSAIGTQGPDWSWVTGLAQPLEIEGLRAGEAFAWAARESGWRLEYADEPAATLAREVVLHGSGGGLSVAEAPGVVAASCGLSYRIVDGVLLVSSPGTSGS